MKADLAHFLGRGKYERVNGKPKHSNGSYPRGFCIKGIREIGVRVPRDRNGNYQKQVLLWGKRYEERITEDLSIMYLTGISTKTELAGKNWTALLF